MGEPNQGAHHKAIRHGGQHADDEPYAADVLLIADSAGDHEHGNRGSGTATVEPLDMESVVRKLIALLNEQQP